MSKKKNVNSGFKKKIWNAACVLMKHIPAPDYRNAILGLIFLRYVSCAFDKRYQELVAEGEGFENDPDAYIAECVFPVPKKAHWSTIAAATHTPEIGKVIDDAMLALEADNNELLENVLPKNYKNPSLDKQVLSEVVDLFTNMDMGDMDKAKDLLVRTYEFCIARFSAIEAKKGGEFYTPPSVVKTLVSILKPFDNCRIYDPCCGSGDMIVQSAKFIQENCGRQGRFAPYAQEANAETWKMAKMNLFIHGIEAIFGEHPADTLVHDIHPDMKAHFILSNPPFNCHTWGQEKLKEDPRWEYGLPPANNANFAWIQHMIYHLAPNGKIGLVLPNEALSSQSSAEKEIRRKIIEADLVEGIIALPAQLYSVTVPVSLWFISKNKKQKGRTLFIDAQKMGYRVDRAHRELSDKDIEKLADTFTAFQEGKPEEIKGFCAVAALQDIARQDYILTPGLYVGIEGQEADGKPSEGEMAGQESEPSELFDESDKARNEISKSKKNLKKGSGRKTKSNQMTKQHEDFGEKIGGAKKDLWRERGLLVHDLIGMNDREAEKFVKKDNIWKNPDYPAMLDDGVPLSVAYFIKRVRDSLRTSPYYPYSCDTPEKRRERQKEYIETVRQLRDLVEGVRTVEDAMQVFDRFMVDNEYVRIVEGQGGKRSYIPTDKQFANSYITYDLTRILSVRSASWFNEYYTKEAQDKQFCVPKDQKVPAGYDLCFCDRKESYPGADDCQPGNYYVRKDGSIIQANFKSREEALRWVQEYAKQQRKSGKASFVPKQLEHVRRDGPDYRSGRDITGQDYLDVFGFRGGEFGNWTSQKDRQASLNMGFEALKDLASVLRISDKDISFQGDLAIAFGARGSGKAAAHYEPMRKVINLTKMHGAGCLAHEWWHGLDDYLGGKMGARTPLLSNHPQKYPLFNKLIETMKYKPETMEQASIRTEKENAWNRKYAESRLDSDVLYSVERDGGDRTLEQYAALKASFLSGKVGTVDKINAWKKSFSGRVIPKDEREHLKSLEQMLHRMQEQQTPTVGRTETDYYRNSMLIGRMYKKDRGYWDSNVEMTARAFACYVMDKLPYDSDYLVGQAEVTLTPASDDDGEQSILSAYPQGKERQAINAVFDEIFADLKLRNILTHADVTLPLQAQRISK